jgi:hypothetical protein
MKAKNYHILCDGCGRPTTEPTSIQIDTIFLFSCDKCVQVLTDMEIEQRKKLSDLVKLNPCERASLYKKAIIAATCH